jgi:hypothetical protein
MGKPRLISKLMHKILIYLHVIHLLKSSTCFEHYTEPRTSSFLTDAQDSHRYQRLHIYNYEVDLLKMSRVMLETCKKVK